MKQKIREWEEARRLRENGCSVKEIANKVGVSRGSVSLWVRDIVLTSEQKQVLLERNPIFNIQMVGSHTNRTKAIIHRKEWQEEGRRLVRSGSRDFLLLCALYWAEGSKNKNVVTMTNSDIDMLRFFVSSLKGILGCVDEKISVRVAAHTTNGLTIDEINHYWTDNLGLPIECLRKFISKTKYYGENTVRKNYHPYGCCAVTYCETRVVQIIFGGIQEIFGIEKKEWMG